MLHHVKELYSYSIKSVRYDLKSLLMCTELRASKFVARAQIYAGLGKHGLILTDLHKLGLNAHLNAIIFRIPALSFETKSVYVISCHGKNSVRITKKSLKLSHMNKFEVIYTLFVTYVPLYNT